MKGEDPVCSSTDIQDSREVMHRTQEAMSVLGKGLLIYTHKQNLLKRAAFNNVRSSLSLSVSIYI